MIQKHKLSWRDSPATLGIIAVNIMVYIALNTIPDLADVLLLSSDISIIRQQFWTLVTVFVSHEVLVHLLANMGLLFFFGQALEKITSARTVVLVYMITGFAGSLTIPPFASFIEWGASEPIAGASAAVFGVVAAFAAMRPEERNFLGYKAQHWMLALFISNAVWLITNPQASVGAAAHGTGIVVGLLYGYWFKRRHA